LVGWAQIVIAAEDVVSRHLGLAEIDHLRQQGLGLNRHGRARLRGLSGVGALGRQLHGRIHEAGGGVEGTVGRAGIGLRQRKVALNLTVLLQVGTKLQHEINLIGVVRSLAHPKTGR